MERVELSCIFKPKLNVSISIEVHVKVPAGQADLEVQTGECKYFEEKEYV